MTSRSKGYIKIQGDITYNMLKYDNNNVGVELNRTMLGFAGIASSKVCMNFQCF